MRDCTRLSFQRKIDWLRCQFAQHASLPFSEVLPTQVVTSALETLCMRCYDSLYNPVTVLWLFLSQVIPPNPTLAATVENFLAWRLAQGMPSCSTDTGGYARARQRLPEDLLAMLVRHTGAAADRAALAPWRWMGRTVKLFDGSTVSMPDTPENQAAYPQSRAQAEGVGFPLARIGVLFSLSVGTVLNLGVRRWAAKHDKHPRQISFTRTMRTLEAFRLPLAHVSSRQLAVLYEPMLEAIASHEIANRPNRRKPRQRKRRPKPYKLMTKPRPQARKQEAITR